MLLELSQKRHEKGFKQPWFTPMRRESPVAYVEGLSKLPGAVRGIAEGLTGVDSQVVSTDTIPVAEGSPLKSQEFKHGSHAQHFEYSSLRAYETSMAPHQLGQPFSYP